jgi:hypothetical protein
VVVQRGVAGRVAPDRIGLKAGWHPVSLRLGSSQADLKVTYPDGQTLPMNAAVLRRPAQVRVRPVGDTGDSTAWEIYGPARFVLAPPEGVSGEIRYTLDGTDPGPASPRADGPIAMDGSAILRATLFDRDHALTAPANVVISRVTRPEADLVARLDFGAWDGHPGVARLDPRCSSWTAVFASRGDVDGHAALVSAPAVSDSGPGGVDINLSRDAGRIPLKLYGLRLRDPAFTVGLWFRSDTGVGQLFGKSGLTAFGKSYKTVSVGLGGGQLRADPGRLAGGKVKPGQWHHAVLSSTPARLALYLDGKLVDEGPGAPGLDANAFDFLADHPGAVAGVAVYNRELPADAVACWYAAENH